MAFDFPASPTDGTSYSPAGGPTYIFSGGVWKISGGGGAFVVVADAAPASPYPGMLWWESDTGALFFWYVDADSSQWVQINFTPSGARTAETRNRIVNGAMQISQENGNTAGQADNYFPVDQWKLSFGGGGVLSGQRVAAITPNGSPYRLRMGVVTADVSIAAGDHYEVVTTLEGIRISDFSWGTAQAKQIILRFGFKGPAGVYTVRLGNYPVVRSYPVNFTISAGQANTDTVQTFVIPGDTTGAWAVDTAGGLVLTINFAAGTTYQGTANAWQAGNFFCTAAASNMMASSSNTFELFDVGLYLDPDATGLAPKWVMPDEAQELAACQRYYVKFGIVSGSYVTFFGGYASVANIYSTQTIAWPVPMRIIPALAPTWGGAVNSPTGSINAAIDHASAYIQSSAAGAFTQNLATLAVNARM